MDFEWDRNKSQANDGKHGVSFEEATEVFAADYSYVVADPDHSTEEDRFILFGKTFGDRFLVGAFTERDDRIRIISARPMTRPERKAYEQ